MRFLRFCSVALVLLLSAVMAHAAGFQDLSFPAGPGKPELKYHLLVPEGVTITNKKGEVVKGGQIVLVPGANVTILEPAYVKTQMENPEFKAGFINADNSVSRSSRSSERRRPAAGRSWRRRGRTYSTASWPAPWPDRTSR